LTERGQKATISTAGVPCFLRCKAGEQAECHTRLTF
jgi:hypothetical protein